MISNYSVTTLLYQVKLLSALSRPGPGRASPMSGRRPPRQPGATGALDPQERSPLAFFPGRAYAKSAASKPGSPLETCSWTRPGKSSKDVTNRTWILMRAYAATEIWWNHFNSGKHIYLPVHQLV